MPTLNINGKDTAVDADESTPILWALRDTLGLTGTRFGCGQALCGACTVHLNGAPIRSCITPISAAAGQKITTIEAVTTNDKVGKAVHAAWVKHDVAQCGYCQSGQIMSATALLQGGGVRGVFVEFGALVALAKIGDGGGHGHDCARRKSLAAIVFRGFGSDRLWSNLYSLILARQ